MHSRTAKKILTNDDELNIGLMAEAHAEVQRLETNKKKRAPSMQRSLSAWMRLKARDQSEEAWRQKVKKVWDSQNST